METNNNQCLRDYPQNSECSQSQLSERRMSMQEQMEKWLSEVFAMRVKLRTFHFARASFQRKSWLRSVSRWAA